MPNFMPSLAAMIIPRTAFGMATGLLPSHLPELTADWLGKLLDRRRNAAQMGD